MTLMETMTERSNRRQIDAPEGKDLLVKPSGYRLLVILYRANDRTDGGIIKPDELLAREDQAQTVGYVVAMGPDCFTNKSLWPSGEPGCEVGDYIIFRSYAGTRFKLEGSDAEWRLLNDDAVEAVTINPDKMRRAA